MLKNVYRSRFHVCLSTCFHTNVYQSIKCIELDWHHFDSNSDIPCKWGKHDACRPPRQTPCTITGSSLLRPFGHNLQNFPIFCINLQPKFGFYKKSVKVYGTGPTGANEGTFFLKCRRHERHVGKCDMWQKLSRYLVRRPMKAANN